MSFETITIYRDLPSIDGFVQTPNNTDTDKTRVTIDDAESLIVGSETIRLSLGSGRQRGSKCGQQEFLRLPGISPNEWYDEDPVDALSS